MDIEEFYAALLERIKPIFQSLGRTNKEGSRLVITTAPITNFPGNRDAVATVKLNGTFVEVRGMLYGKKALLAVYSRHDCLDEVCATIEKIARGIIREAGSVYNKHFDAIKALETRKEALEEAQIQLFHDTRALYTDCMADSMVILDALSRMVRSDAND